MRRLAVAAIVLASAASASANGRRPFTNGIEFQPGDNNTLWVATTFGLLVSHDEGCTFNWICEDNVGYGGAFDPKYAVSSKGTLFAGTLKGLRASYDGGCSFQTVTSPVFVAGVDIASDGTIWIATGEAGITNDVFTSINDGYTWQPAFHETTERYDSLKVAPSNPQRVYATTIVKTDPKSTHLYEFDAGTWTEQPLTGVSLSIVPDVNVAAVDPTNPDLFYLVSIGGSDTGDILYRTTDGGHTLTSVLTTADPIRSVVIAGSSVYVATSTNAQNTPSPAFASTDNGLTFGPMAGAPDLLCLSRRADGTLFGCGENWDPDFKAVAISSDAANWSKVFRFVNLAGPLSCPSGTAEADTCEPAWPMVQTMFMPTGPSCGANASDAGMGGDATPTTPGGCSAGGPGALLAGLGVVFVLRRRQRPAV